MKKFQFQKTFSSKKLQSEKLSVRKSFKVKLNRLEDVAVNNPDLVHHPPHLHRRRIRSPRPQTDRTSSHRRPEIVQGPGRMPPDDLGPVRDQAFQVPRPRLPQTLLLRAGPARPRQRDPVLQHAEERELHQVRHLRSVRQEAADFHFEILRSDLRQLRRQDHRLLPPHQQCRNLRLPGQEQVQCWFTFEEQSYFSF